MAAPRIRAIPRILVLALLCVLIVASVFVGELACRLDETFLRYSYVQTALDEWLAPLSNTANHDAFVKALLQQIRTALDWRVPVSVQPIMEQAANESFSSKWMTGVVKQMHARAFALMRNQAQTIELTVPLGNFLTSVSDQVRAELPVQAAQNVVRSIGMLPRSIDVWASLDDATRTSAERWIRRIPFISVMLQYALPGLFIGLTLLFRRPGSAMVTSGAGIAGGGIVMLIYLVTGAARTAANAGLSVSRLLPGRPEWIVDPVRATVLEALSSGRAFALILIGIGAVIAFLGYLVIRRWSDSFRTLMGKAGDLLRDR